MRKLICLRYLATLTVVLAGQIAAFGQPGPARTVQEIQEGANTEYNVVNDSSGLFPVFNIDAFAVASTGGNPFTADAGWIAEALNSGTWSQSMGGVGSGLPSWFEYTGMTFAQAFPGNPADVNGYTHAPGMDAAIAPGNSLDGFFFEGEPDSRDRFMLVNVHGPAIVEGQLITEFGTVEVAPEPGTFGLSALVAMCVGVRVISHRLRKTRP